MFIARASFRSRVATCSLTDVSCIVDWQLFGWQPWIPEKCPDDVLTSSLDNEVIKARIFRRAQTTSLKISQGQLYAEAGVPDAYTAWAEFDWPSFAATEAARSLVMILRRRMSFDANFKVGYTKYVFQLSVFHAVDNK